MEEILKKGWGVFISLTYNKFGEIQRRKDMGNETVILRDQNERHEEK